jgi:hypothetical protein
MMGNGMSSKRKKKMYKGERKIYVNNTGRTCFWEVLEEATYDAKLVQRRSTADRSGKKFSTLFARIVITSQ